MELARFRRKDITTILSWIRTEADMVQWAGPIFSWPLTQTQFRKHLQAATVRPPALYPFALHNRERIVGYCELAQHSPNANSAMLSRVLIAPRHRRKGFAEYMTREILRIGFDDLGLNRIGLGVFDFNEPAIGCYSKAGFVLEGTLRESAKVGSSYWNCHLMSILRREWRS